jgi:DNA-binding NarL/FixJ family response regulator
MVSILVVEHPPAVRRTLSARLALEADLAVVAEAGDAPSAAALAGAHRPDVVLLDAEMPHLDLRAAVRAIGAESAGSAYVVLSLDPTGTARLLRTGAAGAVHVGKDEGTAALPAAIRQAAGRGGA